MIPSYLTPSERDLKWFGAAAGASLLVIGTIIYWRTGSAAAAAVFGALAILLSATYYTVRASRRPIYVAWMSLVYPLRLVLFHAVLILTYYLMVTPLSLLFKAFGRDRLERRFAEGDDSYWAARDPDPADAASYFRQF